MLWARVLNHYSVTSGGPDIDSNPYAAPDSIIEEAYHAPPKSYIAVEGSYLVVGPETRLPARCVVNNQPAKESERRLRELTWAPPFRLVLRPKICLVSYCISRRSRRPIRIYRLTLLAGVLVGTLLWGAQAFILLLLTAAFLGQLWKSDPIWIRKVEGDYYWIAGCGREFVRSCREQYGEHPR